MSKCPIGDKERKMVNFKLGEEIRKDGHGIINMSRAWDKEKI